MVCTLEKVEMDRIYWIEYKNKKILFCDFSGLEGTRYVNVLKEITELIVKYPKDSPPLRIINNTTSTTPPNEFKKHIDALVALKKERGVIEAMYGVSTIGKIFLRVLNSNLHIVESLDEAKEWIVSQPENKGFKS